MESISKILDAITAEGKADAKKIAENGRKNAAEAYRLYEREAGISEEAILGKAAKRAEEIQQSSMSQAGIESRNIKLSARRDALEQTFSKAAEKLAAVPAEQKKALYEKLIGTYSSGDAVVIQLNGTDKKDFGKKIKVKGIQITVEEETGDFSGGLIIKERDMETNCTFEVIVENAKKEMESEIAAMLFS